MKRFYFSTLLIALFACLAGNATAQSFKGVITPSNWGTYSDKITYNVNYQLDYASDAKTLNYTFSFSDSRNIAAAYAFAEYGFGETNLNISKDGEQYTLTGGPSGAGNAPSSSTWFTLKLIIDGIGVVVTDQLPYEIGSSSGDVEEDTEKPVMVSAVLKGNAAPKSATITANATDNSGSATIEVATDNAFTTILKSENVQSGADTDIALALEPETSYTLYVRAKDAAGNISDDVKTVAFTTPAIPTTMTSAPTPPERPASKVVSVFSDAYTAATGWNFGEWGSGTVYTAEKIGETDNVAKFVTTALGYFGWQLTSDVNVLAMEYLHIDFYSDEEFTLNVYPICRTQNQGEKSQPVTVHAYTWTSVDLPLSVYTAGGLDLSGVTQFKFGEMGARTLYIDNVYFYNTSTDVDTEAPTGLTATKGAESFFSVTLNCQATDNSGVVNFVVKDAANNVDQTFGGTSGEEKACVVSNLQPGTAYNFTITAVDAEDNECATAANVNASTLSLPAPANAPAADAADVISIYSDTYTPATTIGIGGWGQTTAATEIELAANEKAWYLDNFNYLGWELNGNAANFDATGMQFLHVDVYAHNCTLFQVTPIWGGELLYTCTPIETGKWNSFDIDLTSFTGINLANIYQFKFVAEPSSSAVVFLDNVYFYKPGQGGSVNAANATDAKVYAANGTVHVIGAAGKTVSIFTVSGAQVYDAIAGDATTINLEKGMYVVIVDGKATKVVL